MILISLLVIVKTMFRVIVLSFNLMLTTSLLLSLAITKL